MHARRLMLFATGAVAVALSLQGCRTPGTPGGSSFYQCDARTRLTVDYTPGGAIVRVNRGRAMTLRQTPSVAGSVYEGRAGQRLERRGGYVVWNTALRTAPQTCQSVIVPR